MAERAVKVESYSGYKADERPIRILFDTQTIQIAEIEDRWYSPGATYFRVLANDGDRYILRHLEAQDSWTLEGFRASAEANHSIYGAAWSSLVARRAHNAPNVTRLCRIQAT